MLLHERADALDGFAAFFELAREDLPDVDHAGPDFEGHVDALALRLLREAQRVVEQDFAAADLDQLIGTAPATPGPRDISTMRSITTRRIESAGTTFGSTRN